MAGSCLQERVNGIQAREVTAKAEQRLWLCKHTPILDMGTEVQLSGLSQAGFRLVRIDAHLEVPGN